MIIEATSNNETQKEYKISLLLKGNRDLSERTQVQFEFLNLLSINY